MDHNDLVEWICEMLPYYGEEVADVIATAIEDGWCGELKEESWREQFSAADLEGYAEDFAYLVP